MSIEIKKMPDEHAILITLLPPPLFPQDTLDLHQAVSNFKKEIGAHVYRIVDLTHIPVTFAETVQAMAADMNPDGGVNDPDVSTVYIGMNEWLKFGTKAFQEQEQYGKTNVKELVTSLDDALAFIRKDRGISA